ncbi:hypothetical protein HK097_002625 [Rhizophlyctis rosea]|uniref:PPPDE domain-containing protein n=1 Tax=Rhizophlyctis rosea TaxID=64517 RepID=A0AAD5S3C0_9FUNG|nr:hypothetical protein HK097_002625 [Rhizophlyctis rosea]
MIGVCECLKPIVVMWNMFTGPKFDPIHGSASLSDPLDEVCQQLLANLNTGPDFRNAFIVAKRKVDWNIGNFNMKSYRPKLHPQDIEAKLENRRVFKNAFPECFIHSDRADVTHHEDEELRLNPEAYAEYILTLVDERKFMEKHLRCMDQDWREMAGKITRDIFKTSENNELKSDIKTIVRNNSTTSVTSSRSSTTLSESPDLPPKSFLQSVAAVITSPFASSPTASPLEIVRELTTEGMALVDEAYDRAVESFRETLRVFGSSMNVGVMDTEEKYLIVAKACTHYNGTQTYDVKTNNCQTFVNHVLSHLHIPPFNPQDEFAVFWHSISKTGTSEFRYKNQVFHNRKEFDVWVGKHWDQERRFWDRRLLVCFDEMMERRFEREVDTRNGDGNEEKGGVGGEVEEHVWGPRTGDWVRYLAEFEEELRKRPKGEI